MTTDIILPEKHVSGRVRAYSTHEGNAEIRKKRDAQKSLRFGDELWVKQTDFRPNKITLEWGAIIGNLLTQGLTKFRIAGMYLEFENVASPGDPVSVPSLDRTRDIEYYNDLAGSGSRDYLRVPMTANTFTSSDLVRFPKGNMPTFFARSQGLEGVHGKSFSDSTNSVIFGASLLAYVDDQDATQDLVFSSFYFEIEDQQPKLSTSQVGLEWQLQLQ